MELVGGPCDRDFGLIKNALHKMNRVFTLDDVAYWLNVKQKGNFSVTTYDTFRTEYI
jgi:hypothetical protein